MRPGDQRAGMDDHDHGHGKGKGNGNGNGHGHDGDHGGHDGDGHGHGDAEAERVTAPMQSFTTAQVGLGAAVAVVGLLVTFGLPLLLL
jgi:hypothetical protein